MEKEKDPIPKRDEAITRDTTLLPVFPPPITAVSGALIFRNAALSVPYRHSSVRNVHLTAFPTFSPRIFTRLPSKGRYHEFSKSRWPGSKMQLAWEIQLPSVPKGTFSPRTPLSGGKWLSTCTVIAFILIIVTHNR